VGDTEDADSPSQLSGVDNAKEAGSPSPNPTIETNELLTNYRISSRRQSGNVYCNMARTGA